MISRKECAGKLLSFILAIGCATGTACAVSLPADTWQVYAAETGSSDATTQGTVLESEGTEKTEQPDATGEAAETSGQAGTTEVCSGQEDAQSDTAGQESEQPDATSQEAAQGEGGNQETEQSDASDQETKQPDAADQKTEQSDAASQDAGQITDQTQTTNQADTAGQKDAKTDMTGQEDAKSDASDQETEQTDTTDQEIEQSDTTDQETGEAPASADADTDTEDQTIDSEEGQTAGQTSVAADETPAAATGQTSAAADQTPVATTGQTAPATTSAKTTGTASATTAGQTSDQRTAAATGTANTAAGTANVTSAESAAVTKGTAAAQSTTGSTQKVTLDKPTNLRWEGATVLHWDKVKDARKYRIVLTVKSGSVKYTKKITVKGKTSFDLESKIVSIIKAHKSKFKGAAYTVTVKVSALSSDTKNFKNGKAVQSPTIRYLRTTYDEAVSRNGWYEREGDWFYYEKGKKQTGWITFQNKRYYLDGDGKLLTNRWLGKRYLKSNGEMATDEWVDDYQFYVNKKGLKVSSVKYSTKNWVETKKGWRYKKSGGGYVKNTWKTINHRVYYFDKKGYMKTGWFKVGGKKYHCKATGEIETGLGARETGWVQVGQNQYWCDDKGVLATNQWVDRCQYYVGSKGKRVDTLTYQNLRNVNTSNRLGYFVYQPDSPPEQSLAGYNLAYQNGNRIFVADLRFTKDNIPVCFHDDLVKYARDKNGRIPMTAPSVSGLTLKELSEFDYGVYRGADYKGTQLLTLEEMAKWIKSHKDVDLYVEVKTDKMNAAQTSGAVKILKKYGITDRTSMVFNVTGASDTRAKRVHKAAPTLRIGLMGGRVNKPVFKQAASAKGSKNDVFLYCWGGKQANIKKTKLSAATVKKLRELDISYECGTFGGKTPIDEIMRYYAVAAPYSYNSGVETEGAVFKKELVEATCHEKAKWVEDNNKKFRYQLVDRTYAKNTWITSGKNKYYVNSEGYMVTGWLTKGGKRYYMGTDGAMATGSRTIDGKTYKFGKDGALVK